MGFDLSRLSDKKLWTVTILPVPKRQQRAKALGFCGGFAVGSSEGTGYHSNPCWWPNGKAEALTFPDQKKITARRGRGNQIAGGWNTSQGGNGGAAGWISEGEGKLKAISLHDKTKFQWTAALGAGGGAYAGYGEPKGKKKGDSLPECAIFWAPDGSLIQLPALDGDALAESTDGTWVVGQCQKQMGQHATLSDPMKGTLELLGPEKTLSEAYSVRDGEQVGVVWGRGKLGGAAALWHGTANSFIDLTPKGYDNACANDCAQGLQIGHVQKKSDTKGGFGSMAVNAALWAGDAKSMIDLQAFVPEPWNASAAWAIEVDGKKLRIAGEVTQYTVDGELTKKEMHYLSAQTGAIWEAELS